MSLTVGTRLGPYEILEPIGAGGMGEVYRARQVTLRRDVAIKILPPELATDPTRLARFEREARTASALNHPTIIVIHDIATHEGVTYIAMELVEGRTLRDVIAEGPLSIDRVLSLGSQIADGLARAHGAGVIHRDIKPANVMVTGDGLVKILDFGLAKALTADGRESSRTTLESREGTVAGTPLYMSPEQVSGDRVDHRSDQFSLGVVLYEMVVGKPPFEQPSLIRAILTADPPPLRRLRPEAPADLERIVRRCLEKDAGKRYASTSDLATALRELFETRRARATHGLAASLRKPRVLAPLSALVLAVGAASVVWVRGAEARWARTEAVPQITDLIEQGDLYQAYRTTRRAQRYRVDDAELERLLNRISLPIAINTQPAGAVVSVKAYGTPDESWEHLGVTPMSVRIPYALMHWRITKTGYEPFEGAPFSAAAFGVVMQNLVLDSVGTRPAGMVRVPAGVLDALALVRPSGELPAVRVESYFLDRYETTNRQFKAFVDAGGYDKQEYWRAPNETGERWTVPAAVIDSFRDATGRPGPATWEAGTYAVGEDELPVSGVSWHEAAAYCAFVGKRLPTIYHWFHAIGQRQLSDILVHGNLDGQGKSAVGRFKGLSGYGAYDMAGNVREWVWNADGDKRYILGGGWNEPRYVFGHPVSVDPMNRAPTHGIRCAKYVTPAPEGLFAPVTLRHEYDRPPPISDDAFALLRGMYAYNRTPLAAETLSVIDSVPNYRRETVSIRAAYGNERMTVHLLMPRDGSPPYESVIWFPGSDVFLHQSSKTFSSEYLFDFIPRGGRVLVYPVYKGMHERFEPPDFSPAGVRNQVIRWSQDLGRTIDYLETRSDFDARRIAYYGLSGGAVYGPVFTAVDARFAAAIYLGGGLIPIALRPEMHPVLFAPRSRTPTLMINGQDDFIMPYEVSQRPLFELLGAPPDQKRLARLKGGHLPSDRREIIREVFDWLDRYLGPVHSPTPMADAASRP